MSISAKADFSRLYLAEQGVDHEVIPKFYKVRQHFPDERLNDIPGTVHQKIYELHMDKRIHPKDRIAITAGSRQIANMPLILRSIVNEVRALGAEPFVIPAMGSHGGATAEGQKQLLAHYGITEETIGCKIVSDMSTDIIGYTEKGLPVYCSSALIHLADGIILCNRIKPHPGIAGPTQSGLIKMSVIGCGKQKGAETCHKAGTRGMAERLVASSRVVFEKMPVLFGVGIIENAYDETSEIHVIPAEKIHEEEPALLKRAYEKMPKILPDDIDVLYVDRIGKNISGVGADPNVTLRFLVPAKAAEVTRRPPSVFIMGDITEESAGAVSGIGQADIITMRLFEKIDFGKTYVNVMTSTFLRGAKIPVVMRNDEYALKFGIHTCNAPDPSDIRIVRIQDTLHVSEIMISEAVYNEIKEDPRYTVLSGSFELRFDAQGNIFDDSY